MKKSLIFIICVATISFLWGFNASDLRINGFLSQGYIYSTENDYLVKGSQDGSTEYNELGFTVQKNFSPKLRIGFQLLSRDFGELGNNNVVLDWAFADYRWRDYLGFRVGKIKTQMGLYNEGRDVDMLRSTVFLPQSIYDETYRSYFVAIQGANLYGNLPVGNFGSLDYSGFIGNMNFNRDDIPMKDLTSLVNSLLGALNSQQTAYVDMIAKTFTGGSVKYNLPMGLVLGASFVDYKGEAYTPEISITDEINVTGVLTDPTDPTSYTPTALPEYVQSQGLFEVDVNFPMRTIYSFEWQLNNLKISAEYLYEKLLVDTDIEIPINYYLESDPTTPINTEYNRITNLYERESSGYYAMVSYTFFDKLTLSGLYDHCQLDKEKRYNGVNFAEVDLDNYEDKENEKTDMGFAVKYDINFNWSVKLEAHSVKGNNKTSSDLLEGISSSELEEDWNYFLGKISFNF